MGRVVNSVVLGKLHRECEFSKSGLCRRVKYKTKQQTCIGTRGRGWKAGPTTERVSVTQKQIYGDVKAPASSDGRAGPTCRSAHLACDVCPPVLAWKPFPAIPSCSALQVHVGGALFNIPVSQLGGHLG